jgi:hypothetical protein
MKKDITDIYDEDWLNLEGLVNKTIDIDDVFEGLTKEEIALSFKYVSYPIRLLNEGKTEEEVKKILDDNKKAYQKELKELQAKRKKL